MPANRPILDEARRRCSTPQGVAAPPRGASHRREEGVPDERFGRAPAEPTRHSGGRIKRVGLPQV